MEPTVVLPVPEVLRTFPEEAERERIPVLPWRVRYTTLPEVPIAPWEMEETDAV